MICWPLDMFHAKFLSDRWIFLRTLDDQYRNVKLSTNVFYGRNDLRYLPTTGNKNTFCVFNKLVHCWNLVRRLMTLLILRRFTPNASVQLLNNLITYSPFYLFGPLIAILRYLYPTEPSIRASSSYWTKTLSF